MGDDVGAERPSDLPFHYGEEVRLGEPHIVWRRIGTHDIFRQP